MKQSEVRLHYSEDIFNSESSLPDNSVIDHYNVPTTGQYITQSVSLSVLEQLSINRP